MRPVNHYSPLPDSLSIGKSKIHGLGIMALLNIEKGEDLGIGWVMDDNYPDGSIRTPIGGFINHSDSPNCESVAEGKYLHVISIKKIKKGEELTVSYRGWYNDEVLDTYK
ncbi:MAG: SET domain-containing protein-lysine N-methyltransferase [Candidatus Saccharimonadales bacterium]